MIDDDNDSMFNPGQADWITQQAAEHLDQDQRALLLALAQLEAAMGHKLSDEETLAIESLSDQLQGFDAEEIAEAVHRMVNQPTDPSRKTTWSELKTRRDSSTT